MGVRREILSHWAISVDIENCLSSVSSASFHLGTTLLSFCIFGSFQLSQKIFIVFQWLLLVTPEGVYLSKKKKITILLFSIVPYSIKTEAVTKSDSPIRSTITEKHQALDHCYVEYI